MRLCRIVFLLLIALGSVFAARFGLEHSGKIVRVTDPQISPDGRSIAVVVSRANFDENRYDAQIVLVDVAAHTQRILSRERRGLAQPRWSPSGDRLGFLATVDTKPQLFVLPVSGGEPWQVTKAAGGVQHYAWSPDSASIAFVTADEPPKVTGEERHNRSFEIINNDFLVTTTPLPAHVWVISADGGAPRRLTSGAWSLPISFPPGAPSSPLSWSPDGKSLAIVQVDSPYSGDRRQSRVQILDVASGRLRALTGRARYESQPQISPDGRRVAYWYPRDGETRNVNEIYVSPLEGGEGGSVTRAIDRNVQRAIWMPDSRSLLVSANDRTTVGLWIQPLDGAARRVDLGAVVPTATFWLDASANSRGQIALAASEPQRPTEVYYLASPASRAERLSSFQDATAALELGRSETIEWDGPDRFRQDGVVTYPPGSQPSRKYPLVLYIHGGPRSASKQAFSARAQLLAAQGWIVFEPNYRGSDNLGNAFQSAIWNDAGAGPGRDVMSGVEFLVKRGSVDTARMAVSGWSYGGFMTSWLLGNYPDRWKAAVAGAAVTDWLDSYNLSDGNVGGGSIFGGSPWTDPKRLDAYRVQSPISYAQRIKAPTLVLAATGDYRVPPTQSYKLFHALKDNGVVTQFIGYPVYGHSPTDPVHQRDVDRRWVEWLKRYLEDGRTPSAE